MIELSEQEEGLFSEAEEKVIELYYIPVYVQSQLHTDDSFQFNEVVKEVEQLMASLDAVYHEQQDKYEELCTSQSKVMELFSGEKKEFMGGQCVYREVFDEEDEELLTHFLNGVKRRLFLGTVRQIFGWHKHAWAKQTVVQTLKKIYLEKQRFNEREQEELEDMIS